MSEPCSHFEFEGFTEFTRMTESDYGQVIGYSVTLRARCKDCKLPFMFKGLPGGLSFRHPTTGTIPYEARLPLEPVPLDERADVETAIELADRMRQDFLQGGDT